MADANGSGPPPQEDDPDRTQRIPSTHGVVDEWFTDDSTPDTEQTGGDQ